jgi:hypothetical protein
MPLMRSFYYLYKKRVCSLISKDGFGVRNLLMFNRVLLEKWLWRYVHEREAWWRVMVDSKFGNSWGVVF